VRAVPAVVEENKDGCWLRYSDSASTWWAGATLLHGNPRSRQLVRRTKCGTCALAAWAISQGLEHMYLQAERTNAAALDLYGRAGFEELCTYHYRTAAPGALTMASPAGEHPLSIRRRASDIQLIIYQLI